MTVTDFHSHILPSLDHGCSGIEECHAQLKIMSDAGTTVAVATPHFYPHRHLMDDFLRRREHAYKTLKPHIPDGMQVKLGAEVLICEGIQNIPGIERLFVEGTRTLLLELPFHRYETYFDTAVKELIEQDIDVVIAHADRYDEEVVEKMLKAGARLQLNADSLDRFFKRRTLFDWVNSGDVIALGSDIHGKDKDAYKHFTRAISKVKNQAEYIQKESDLIFNK